VTVRVAHAAWEIAAEAGMAGNLKPTDLKLLGVVLLHTVRYLKLADRFHGEAYADRARIGTVGGEWRVRRASFQKSMHRLEDAGCLIYESAEAGRSHLSRVERRKR